MTHERRLEILALAALTALMVAGFLLLSGCTMPSDGWFQRIEQNVSEIREATQKAVINTSATAKAVGTAETELERERLLREVPRVPTAPSDSNTADWLETVLYILTALTGATFLGTSGTRNFLGRLAGKQATQK